MKKYKLIDQYVWDISNDEINQLIMNSINLNKKLIISNVNANAYYISKSNKDFYNFQKRLIL